MVKKTYLELLKGLLEFDFKVLCPWKEGSDKSKLSKLYRACFYSPLICAGIMSSFVFFKRKTLSFLTVAENAATTIGMLRSVGYALLVKRFYFDYKKQMDKLIEDRQSLPLELKEQTMTDSYCKTEFIVAAFHHALLYCIPSVFLNAFVYFYPNAYQLPLNCFVFFLPPDEFLFAWELNLLVMAVMVIFVGIFVASFLPIPFLMMNHSCWLLDMALLTAEDTNEHLKQDDDIRNPERVRTTDDHLKKFLERCEKFVEWQNECQGMLSLYFNLEFQVMSIIFCLSIYVLSFTLSGGAIFIFFTFSVAHIFNLCWMGARITTRIDQLSYQISKNWYLMPPKQRKALQMILHWTQNMTTFTGWFKDVSLETCKSIFEASYSFYAFLRSTNGN